MKTTLAFITAGLIAISSAGCAKKPPAATDQPLAAATPSGAVADQTVASGDPAKVAPPALHLRAAYFEFDAYTLSADARAALTADATIVLAHPGAAFRIEGNCDERGSTQFNIALGQRRALAARDYLLSLGASPGQLTVVSYGKEKPVDGGHDEAAWARNRRVELTTSASLLSSAR